MMKLLISFTCFLAMSSNAFSQIDMENFESEISDFTVVDSVSDTESIFVKTFASDDSTLVYDVHYNLQGELSKNSWGVAVRKRILDEYGRKTESCYFDEDGELLELDAPPIIQTVYLDSISVVQINYLNEDRTVEGRIESTLDEQKREIETRNYDGNLKLYYRTTLEYNDVEQTCTIKDYDASSKLKSNDCGFAIKVITFENGYFDRYTPSSWIEERYYDKEMRLVDCEHNYFSDEPFSIVQREKLGDNRMRIILRNKQNKIISSVIFSMEE